MAEETIRLVRKVADEMGYRRPVQKRLDSEREEQAGRPDRTPSLCLLLPYPFREYSYTKLDLMMMDAAEHCMHEAGGMLYTTRLTEDGKLPGWLVERGVDAVVMKSYPMPSARDCPLLYTVPVVSLFGFNQPAASSSWVTADTQRGVQEVWDQVMVPEECVEVILVGTITGNHEFREKSTFLNAFCERENLKFSECSLSAEDGSANLSKLVNRLDSAKRKPLVYVARTSEMDVTCALKLTEVGVRPGSDAEIVVESYDCDPSRNPDFHWLDLRGRDLVRAAVQYALHPGSRTQSRIQLPPKLVAAGTHRQKTETYNMELKS